MRTNHPADRISPALTEPARQAITPDWVRSARDSSTMVRAQSPWLYAR